MLAEVTGFPAVAGSPEVSRPPLREKTSRFRAGLSIPGPAVRPTADDDSYPASVEHVMKFVCLGYADMKKFSELSPQELSARMDECFAYDDQLRRGRE